MEILNPEKANLQIIIAGLPTGVAANVQVSGPNNFQKTVTTSATLPNLATGTYSFVVSEVKPDSATFGKTADSPAQVELIAGSTNTVALAYSCTLVSPPDVNLDAVLKEKTGKDTYNCADLAALTELVASSRSIQSIEGLQYGTGLTKLFLDNNQIANLPDGIFDDLTNLTSLELANNKLVDLSNGPFDKLSGLTILTLTTNQLTSLPDHVFDALSSLTSLSLSLNKLNSLPNGIFDQLSQLKFLSLDRNSLSSLPIGIFAKLSALSELNLQGNKLTSLPVDSFDKLSNLNDLLLGDNQLAKLPNNSFDNLTNLTDLGLDRNQLTSLPSGIFNKLTKLTKLNLVGNQLTSLPSGIFDTLINLTDLFLADNELENLPPGIFDNLAVLDIMELDGNKLNSLPIGLFDTLTNLTELVIRSNCLQLGKVPTKGQLFALENQGTDVFASPNPKADCASVPQPVTFSNFDKSTEGWTVTGDGTKPSHIPSGGNPGGFIQSTDSGFGSTWYWKAPALYYGDVRDYIGKSLKFSLKQSATDNQFDDLDIILKSGPGFGFNLVADITAPGTSFTDYEIILTRENFTPLQTELAFSNFLSELSSLEIRGEYRDGADTGALDSVRFGD